MTVLPPSLFGWARADATVLGGTLATIRSAAENDWLQGILPGDDFWIGYNDATVEGTYMWHSLETPGYENWAPGAPGNFTADQDYVAFRPSDGTWDTWFLNDHYRAVVESNAIDCDGDLVPDDVQIQNDPSLDCDGNGQIDSCEILLDSSLDCDGDGALDLCSVQDPIFDCDGNGLVDSCEIANNPALDCNNNLLLDSCDILDPTQDCDGNGLVDLCEIYNDFSLDCNNNLWLDSCELIDPLLDCDSNGHMDECEIAADSDLDCNGNLILDSCETLDATEDCDSNGQVDSCEITANPNLDCNNNAILDLCEVLDPALDMNGDGLLDSCIPPTYCTGAPNSSGNGGSIMALGSPELALNNLTLHASSVASQQWSYFLMSQNQASVPDFGGSQGVLCLGAPIVRFIMPGTGQVNQTSVAGERSYALDFNVLPQGIVFQPGDTWNFQLWFRDLNPGATSNTTDGVTVMFR
jgi:hypothetical protein